MSTSAHGKHIGSRSLLHTSCSAGLFDKRDTPTGALAAGLSGIAGGNPAYLRLLWLDAAIGLNQTYRRSNLRDMDVFEAARMTLSRPQSFQSWLCITAPTCHTPGSCSFLGIAAVVVRRHEKAALAFGGVMHARDVGDHER